jgi:predicted ATPase
VALGRAAGDPPDRFFVALATLGLIAAVAEEQPLLCVVDDLQWLDDASARVLGFVARRLLAESVALWHLKKVFMQLGISSRRDLRDALPAPGDAVAVVA